jgi:hypothetical protein
MADEPITDIQPEPSPNAFAFPDDLMVPADLAGACDDDLRAALGRVKTYAAGLAARPPSEITDETVAALTAARDFARDATAELSTRAQRTTDAAALAADIDAAQAPEPVATEPDPEPEPEPEVAEPVAVTAAGRRAAPRVRDVARGAHPPSLPADADRPAYASMVAAADVPGFVSGARLDAFADAARALEARLGQFPTMPAGRRAQASRAAADGKDGRHGRHGLVMKSFTRQGAVQFKRDFPAELRIDQRDDAEKVLGYATSERRLPGGSLLESARQAVTSGRALTAAAGWCAPSETIYDLCELETLDGILDLPEVQADRGGFNLPDNGGPDFGVIFGAIGNAGDTHLTEAEVIADVNKVCTDIPCPEFVEVRLGVDYVCLTGGLLQRRGYPEVVARWSRGAMIALAHKINAGVIADIVTASGATTVIPADPNGDDAASSLLSAVELAIVDAKYRNRMGFGATLEIVLPMWVLAQIRAGLARRTGVAMLAVTDAQILDWFRERKAVPRFVYDWQDAYSGEPNGPGNATPLADLPTLVQFLIYPAGTWTKAVQSVVNLDTIYDSTKLATNEYTAIFAEDGWAALQSCPLSRLYTVPVDPSGVVGCCEAVGS